MSMDSLMREIIHLKTEPPIFKLFVMAAPHLDGFDAWVDFRTYDPDAARSVSTHGDTPEQALLRLKTALELRWIACPHCHRPLAHSAEVEAQ